MNPPSASQLKDNVLDTIRHFRVPDLQAILEYARVSRKGNKHELFERCKLIISSKLTPQLINRINQINIARVNSTRSHHMPIVNNLQRDYRNQQVVLQTPKPFVENLPLPDLVQNVHLPFFDRIRTIDGVNIPVDWNSFSPLRFNLTEFDINFILQGSAKVFLRLSPTIVPEKQNDVLPPFFAINFNGHMVLNNNILKTPGSQAHTSSFPIDITNKLILRVNVPNTINYFWVQSPLVITLKNLPRSYTLKIQLVRYIPLDCLVNSVLKRELAPQINNNPRDNDIEIEDTSLVTTQHRVSLICPITQALMRIPVKSLQCSHLACFDLRSFLQMNERRLQWTCPLCKKPALYENLLVDKRLQTILSNVPPNCSTVEINSSTKNLSDCHYILDNVRQDKSGFNANKSTCQSDDDDDDDDDGDNDENDPKNKSRRESVTSDCVVISSESESRDGSEHGGNRRSSVNSSIPITPLSNDLSNQDASTNDRQRINSTHQSSSERSMESQDDEYWTSLAKITYDFVPDDNQPKSYRKRSASSMASFISNDDDDDDDHHHHHQQKRVKRSTNVKSNTAHIEVIVLSSSDSSDNDDHLS